MPHQLMPPPGGSWLSSSEVTQRLRAEFDWVDVDPETGKSQALALAGHLAAVKAPKEEVSRIEALQHEAVYFVCCDDHADDEQTLSFVVMGHEPLYIGYTDDRHQRKSRPVLQRCAAALGYCIA